MLNIPGGGARQRSCLRHYATSRKVAGSFPGVIIEFFNLPNPSSRTVVDSASNRNDNQESSWESKGRPAHKADNRLSRKYEILDFSKTYGLPRPVLVIALSKYARNIVFHINQHAKTYRGPHYSRHEHWTGGSVWVYSLYTTFKCILAHETELWIICEGDEKISKIHLTIWLALSQC
jgi:hypothetical protein